MRTSTEFDSVTAPAEVAPRGASACTDTPVVIVRRTSAGNDAICEDPPKPADDIESWARHALAANGFGDVATTHDAPSAWPTSYELHRAARAQRSYVLGGIILAAFRAVGAFARRAYLRHRQRQEAKATYDALRQLDDRALHDLGFDRSEIRSIAAEAAGEAEYSRMREKWTSYGLPR